MNEFSMPEVWFPNLGIEIAYLPKVFVSIFGFDIYWYSIMICLGILAGLVYATREAKRTGQNPDDYMDFFFSAFICAIVGARLYYVIFNWKIYQGNFLSIFNLRNGGLAIYGGVIGGVIAAIVFSVRKKFDFWILADTAAPALLLGQAVGRWCNFFNREVFGGFTDSIFAMRYLENQVSYIPEAVRQQMISIEGVRYIQVQPTFFYESMASFAIFIIINIVKKNKKFDGQLLFMYFIGYGIARFFIESIRTDQLFFFGTGIPVSMIVSAILVIFGSVAAVYRYKNHKNVEK